MKEKTIDNFVPKINDLVFQKCRPEWHLSSTFIDNFAITYIVEGKVRYTINGKNHELEAGDLVYLTEGAEVKAAANLQNPPHYYAVNFGLLYSPAETDPFSFPVISHIGVRKELIDMLRELTLCWSGQKTGYITKTRAQLMLILHRLLELLIYNIDSEAVDYRIKKVINYISMHYFDKLTVKALAEKVNLHEFYFGKLFKKEKGMSVNQYIMQIRVRNAESMLQTGNYKVQEVAELCGFSDVAHFYKSFTTVLGFAPSKCIPKNSRGNLYPPR